MAKNYCILRVVKLHTTAAIRGSGKHTWREIETPNADPARRDLNQDWRDVCSSTALVSAIEARLAHITERATATVLALEYLITASPGAWQRHGGHLEDVSQYFRDAVTFLEEMHGKENLVAINIQLDETTPHVALYVVPLLKIPAHTRSRRVIAGPRGADGKLAFELRQFHLPEAVRLSADHFVGGARKLRQLQTDFAKQVGERYGLKRGIEGSRARHVRIQDYYRCLEYEPKVFPPLVDVPRMASKPQEPGLLGRLVGEGAAWRLRQKRWEADRDRRARLVAQRNKQIMERADAAAGLADQNAVLLLRVAQLETQVDELKRENGASRQRNLTLYAQLAQASEIAALFTPSEIERRRVQRAQETRRAEAMKAEEGARDAIRKEAAKRVDALSTLGARGGVDALFAHQAALATMRTGEAIDDAGWLDVEMKTIALAVQDGAFSRTEIVDSLAACSPRLADPGLHAQMQGEVVYLIGKARDHAMSGDHAAAYDQVGREGRAWTEAE